jgi:exopolysaccharide biosynthesis polyprenyl glycosylphosphotransferase
MPEPSLTDDRTWATRTVIDLPLQEIDLPASARRRETLGRLGLLTADAVAVAGALAIVSALTGARFTLWVPALLPLFALLAKTAGLYDRDPFVLHKTTLDETPALLAVGAIFTLVIEAARALEFTGRSQPLLLCGVLTGVLLAARAGARFLAVRLTGAERVLVIGDAPTTELVQRKFAGDAGLNAVVVGRMPVEPDSREFDDTVLGFMHDLPTVLAEHRVERVIVAPRQEGGGDVVDVIRLATACGVRVAVLPRLLQAIGSSVEFDDLGGQALLGVRGFGLSTSSRFLKRTLDLVVATTALVVLSPFLLLVALAIKRSSQGPVLFRQARTGRHGNEFQMLKFRTMVQDADLRKHELLERNEAAPLFKIADDPRVTRVGRFLRRRSLDEIPQLFNVLRGDMSIVGPRPLVTDEDRLFSGWQRRRYHVAPGITGPWQILGSSRVPVSDMVTIDYLYCTNWSLWLDVKIMARTIPYMFSRRSGEYEATQR